MQEVEIHSDGACQGNPGPGGWAARLICGPHLREISGGAPATTNNRMELQAAIEGLAALTRPCQVHFHTDSTYLRDGVTKWIFGWKKNGWLTKAKQPVKNADLWRQLEEVMRPHRIEWRWVKGHAGHSDNERCDALAVAEIAKLRQAHSPQHLKQLLAEFQSAS